jgi:hypothetical protein
MSNPYSKIGIPETSSVSTALKKPECIAVIRVGDDGVVGYRSSTDLSCSRITPTSVGQYSVQISGTVSSELVDADFYWFKVSGSDGDNLYTTNNWSTSGCDVQSRDFPDDGGSYAFQDRNIVVEIWVSYE